MSKYRLLISYDGTHYSGWQIQPNALSIQQKIVETAHIILKEPMRLIGSGRTDAGVHALGQVAHFTTEQPLDIGRFVYSMNCLLPPDIRILHGEEVDRSFHAQFSAIKKEYHYHLALGEVTSPFQRLYTLSVRHRFDRKAFTEAAGYFVGTHDFTTFANAPLHGAVAKNPVRTIYRLDIIDVDGGLRIEFEGNGFLYKMVRNIVGTLLDVSKGKFPSDAIAGMLACRDRRLGGRAAPPQGLFLMKVSYADRTEPHQGSGDELLPERQIEEVQDRE